MQLPRVSGALSYLLALGLVLAAASVRAGLDQVEPGLAPFALFYPAVLTVALLAGLGPATFALATSAAAGVGLGGEPGADDILSSTGAANFALFIVTGAAVMASAIALRRTWVRKLDQQAQLDMLLRHAPAILWRAGPDGRIEFLNERWADYAGPCAADRPAGLQEALHPDDVERARAAWAEAQGRSVFEAQLRLRGRDGRYRAFVVKAEPAYGQESHPAEWLGTAVDMDDVLTTERRLHLMVHELNHRVKNTLSVVQALARSSFRGERSPADNLARFTDRLVSLARTHDILTGETWESADLRDIASRGLNHHDLVNRIRLQGPSIRLTPSAAVSIGMALHELATNAVKYGALSVDGGKVDVTWRRGADGRGFELVWQEMGGPPVSPPTRRGFGSRLIERSLSSEAGAEVSLQFRPTGLICKVLGPAVDAGPPDRPAATGRVGMSVHASSLAPWLGQRGALSF